MVVHECKIIFSETANGVVLLKTVLLKISQNSLENACASVSFLIKLQGTLAQAFSCEFCEIFKKNTCVRVSFLIKLQALQETLAGTGVLL